MIKFTKTVKRSFMDPLTYTGKIDVITNYSVREDISGKIITLFDSIGMVAAILHDDSGDFIEIDNKIIKGADNIVHAIEIINYNSRMTDILDVL